MFHPAELLLPSRRGMFGALGMGAGLAAILASRAAAVSAPPALLYHEATNVKNFQAKGDGATDDYPKLQAALTKANTGGNLLAFLPPGDFAISQPLVPPVNVSMVGVHSVFDVDGISTPVSRISALPGFPASQPLISFPARWTGRFENICIDGKNHATCGVAQISSRGSVNRNINIRNLGNAAPSDYAWLLTNDGSLAAAANLYERVNASIYSIAAGTNGLVCIGSAAAPITENAWLACTFGAGTDAFAANFAAFCDTNWVAFSNFGNNSATLAAVNFNNQGTTAALVQQNNFLLSAAQNAGSGPAVRSSYTAGAAHTFLGCFLQSVGGGASNAAVLGTQGKLNIRSSSFNDVSTLPVATLTPPVAPATWVWTNPFPCPVEFMAFGGTIGAVQMIVQGAPYGIATGQPFYSLWVEPGDGVSVAYTVAPTAAAYPRQ